MIYAQGTKLGLKVTVTCQVTNGYAVPHVSQYYVTFFLAENLHTSG